jgi:hypothetical protein
MNSKNGGIKRFFKNIILFFFQNFSFLPYGAYGRYGFLHIIYIFIFYRCNSLLKIIKYDRRINRRVKYKKLPTIRPLVLSLFVKLHLIMLF